VKITVPFVSCYDQLLYLVSGLLILLAMIISGGPMWHLCYYQSHNKTMPDLVIQHEKKKDGKNIRCVGEDDKSFSEYETCNKYVEGLS